mgnify:CR=1 FL=1
MYKGQHGMTANTLKRIVLGAGTIHKNLTLSGSGNGSFNFEESCMFATSGGNSLEIVGTLYDIPIDGVGVKVQGTTIKTGETGTLTVNALEMSPELLEYQLFGTMADLKPLAGYSSGTTGEKIESKHYVENLAYVGETAADRKPVIIVFERALCTSGLKVDGKSNEANVLPVTFEPYAHRNVNARLTSLGIHIYFPESSTTQSAASAAAVTK